MFELNKDTRIKVKTPVGTSNPILTGENVAQGSLEGSIISSSSLAKGVSDFFESSESELFYGSLKLLPMQLQDDLLRLCKNPMDAQLGYDRLEAMAEVKLLNYNIGKCKIVVMGKANARKKLTEEFIVNPPKLNGKEVELSNEEVYLGDVLGSDAAESISLTIKRRSGLIKKTIFEIKSIVEDTRSKVAGGIETGILLWNSCVLPYMLWNSSSWLQI